ncbi:hypothetical protein YPPY53_3622, partial [Yersinia pestis PY-53]
MIDLLKPTDIRS